MTMRVQVRGTHWVVLGNNGDEIATSKEYADEAGARRSATNFYQNLAEGDIALETATVERSGRGKSSVEKWTRDEVLAEQVPPLLTLGDGPSPASMPRSINVPADGKSGHANSPLATGN